MTSEEIQRDIDDMIQKTTINSWINKNKYYIVIGNKQYYEIAKNIWLTTKNYQTEEELNTSTDWDIFPEHKVAKFLLYV